MCTNVFAAFYLHDTVHAQRYSVRHLIITVCLQMMDIVRPVANECVEI